MNAPAAFLFFHDDFLGGTSNFTDAEAGLYIRLLCAQWSAGSLPDDDAELLAYGKGGSTTLPQRVRAKFDKGTDGRLRNARLEKERVKQEAWRDKSRLGGIKSGISRSASLTRAGGETRASALKLTGRLRATNFTMGCDCCWRTLSMSLSTHSGTNVHWKKEPFRGR